MVITPVASPSRGRTEIFFQMYSPQIDNLPPSFRYVETDEEVDPLAELSYSRSLTISRATEIFFQRYSPQIDISGLHRLDT